jgi:hypothetical protein
MKIKQLLTTGALLLTISRGVASAEEATPLECLTRMVCGIKENVRWRTPAWDTKACLGVAEAVQATAEKYSLSPYLIIGTMVNESELDEASYRVTYRAGKLYAKDGGLGGIRCIIGQDGKRCVNGPVRGMTFKEVMVPATNIEITGRILAGHRDGPCPHKNHAWWVHYNHGPAYIDHGRARHYAHRVAVLYAAALRAADMPITTELKGPITITDKGQKPRTIDKPVGVRQRRLVAQIMACAGTCQKSGTLDQHADKAAAPHLGGGSPSRCAIADLGRKLPGRPGTVSR